MGLIVAAICTAVMALNLAIATSSELAGQGASELAQCEATEESSCLGESDTNKGAMGQHSSSDESGGEQSEPRNALTEHGDPQHPNDVIGTLCGSDGDDCPDFPTDEE
jgi:hypothetical protein